MVGFIVLLCGYLLNGASARYSSGLHKHSIMAKGVQDELRASMDEAMHRELEEKAQLAATFHDDNPLLPQNISEKCVECQRGVYGWVAEHTEQWLKKACEKPKKKMKDLCKLAEEKPKIVCGLLVYWTRPYQSAAAYCVGTKDCPAPEGEGFEETSESLVEQAVQDSAQDIVLHEAFEENSEAGVGIELPNTEAEEADIDVSEKKPKPDKKCMEEVDKHIMKNVITKVEEWCIKKSAKCPKLKKICEWAHEHEEISLGWLLAAVEPWKYSYGYCYPHPKNEGQTQTASTKSDVLFA